MQQLGCDSQEQNVAGSKALQRRQQACHSLSNLLTDFQINLALEMVHNPNDHAGDMIACASVLHGNRMQTSELMTQLLA